MLPGGSGSVSFSRRLGSRQEPLTSPPASRVSISELLGGSGDLVPEDSNRLQGSSWAAPLGTIGGSRLARRGTQLSSKRCGVDDLPQLVDPAVPEMCEEGLIDPEVTPLGGKRA